MEKDNRNAYSEVIEILKFLDDEKKLEALPIEMLEVLKSKANPEYKPQISKEIPLEEQNLQPETLSILTWIAMKYWNDEVNKVEIVILDEDKDMDEKSNTKQEDIEDEEKNNLPILHEELKWYQKIKEKILEIFQKIFNKKKKEGNPV